VPARAAPVRHACRVGARAAERAHYRRRRPNLVGTDNAFRLKTMHGKMDSRSQLPHVDRSKHDIVRSRIDHAPARPDVVRQADEQNRYTGVSLATAPGEQGTQRTETGSSINEDRTEGVVTQCADQGMSSENRIHDVSWSRKDSRTELKSPEHLVTIAIFTFTSPVDAVDVWNRCTAMVCLCPGLVTCFGTAIVARQFRLSVLESSMSRFGKLWLRC
jgi:hypothetical protein